MIFSDLLGICPGFCPDLPGVSGSLVDRLRGPWLVLPPRWRLLASLPVCLPVFWSFLFGESAGGNGDGEIWCVAGVICYSRKPGAKRKAAQAAGDS